MQKYTYLIFDLDKIRNITVKSVKSNTKFKTLDDNIGIEYEDLVNDRRDLMIRSLFYFEDQLSPRLKIWLNSGGELNDKFWSIVKNYLLYLIKNI